MCWLLGQRHISSALCLWESCSPKEQQHLRRQIEKLQEVFKQHGEEWHRLPESRRHEYSQAAAQLSQQRRQTLMADLAFLRTTQALQTSRAEIEKAESAGKVLVSNCALTAKDLQELASSPEARASSGSCHPAAASTDPGTNPDACGSPEVGVCLDTMQSLWHSASHLCSHHFTRSLEPPTHDKQLQFPANVEMHVLFDVF